VLDNNEYIVWVRCITFRSQRPSPVRSFERTSVLAHVLIRSRTILFPFRIDFAGPWGALIESTAPGK